MNTMYMEEKESGQTEQRKVKKISKRNMVVKKGQSILTKARCAEKEILFPKPKQGQINKLGWR